MRAKRGKPVVKGYLEVQTEMWFAVLGDVLCYVRQTFGGSACSRLTSAAEYVTIYCVTP